MRSPAGNGPGGRDGGPMGLAIYNTGLQSLLNGTDADSLRLSHEVGMIGRLIA